jgi:hypothetical protein
LRATVRMAAFGSNEQCVRIARLTTSRPINHEAARAAVASLQGVQSVVWIDRSNLLVMVGGGQYRSADPSTRSVSP